WNYIEGFQKPVIFAINQLDHPKSSYDNALNSLRDRFGSAITQMQYPVNQGDGFASILALLKLVMNKSPPEGGKPRRLPIPQSEIDEATMLHNELVEKAAENDEQLRERYFGKGTLDEDEMRQGLKLGMINRDVCPVFCMSAKKNMGSGRMMGF